MADEIIKELWEVKDELSRKCQQMGWHKYADYLKQTVSSEGFKVVSRSTQMKVAEDSVEYKAG